MASARADATMASTTSSAESDRIICRSPQSPPAEASPTLSEFSSMPVFGDFFSEEMYRALKLVQAVYAVFDADPGSASRRGKPEASPLKRAEDRVVIIHPLA